MRRSYWLLLSSIFICSCDSESPRLELGLDYYPISIGEYRVYDVEETTYLSGEETIESYQLKETFFDQIDNGELTKYLIRVERRDIATDNWTSVSSIAVRQTIQFLEYHTDNTPFVKMSYPVKIGRNWNGNALNNSQEMLYYYTGIEDVDWQYSDPSFGTLEFIKVVINDLQANIVEQDERFEVYAKQIGLVERNFKEIEFCTQSCEATNEPENGRILVQRLVAYGAE